VCVCVVCVYVRACACVRVVRVRSVCLQAPSWHGTGHGRGRCATLCPSSLPLSLVLVVVPAPGLLHRSPVCLYLTQGGGQVCLVRLGATVSQ
jgi:hypothetical protein